MKTLNDLFFRLVEVLLVVMLSAMVVMVFGNVVLRYGFNSSIISSEELSRFLFIWITFLGAIVTLRENAHLGVDTLVRKLSLTGKKTAAIVSNLMMIGCCTLMFYGTFKQHTINASTRSAVTEIPMIWVYGVGYVASIAMTSRPDRAAEPPHRFWTLAEGRAMFELGLFYAARPLMASLPKGDGHAVMTLPGFMASNSSSEAGRLS